MNEGPGTTRGFTLTQLLLAVTALLALALVLPPVLALSVNAARVNRAGRDAARIAAAVDRAARDLGEDPRWVSQADRTAGLSARRLRILAGPGDAPKVAGDASWLASSSDSLTRQLVQNGPGYPTDAADRGWRGPYLQPDAGPDPWGNQFLVWFTDGEGATRAFVVSAGPNGVVDTTVSPADRPEARRPGASAPGGPRGPGAMSPGPKTPGLRSMADVVGDDVVVAVDR